MNRRFARWVTVVVSALCVMACFAATPSSAATARPTLTATPAPAIAGEVVTFRSTVPTHFRRPAKLQYKHGSGWRTLRRVTVPSTGRLSLALSVSVARVYRVWLPRVRHKGRTYPALASYATTVSTVSQGATLAVSGSGGSRTLTARFSPARPGRAVSLSESVDGGAFTSFRATPAQDGTGTATWTGLTLPAGHVYRFRATTVSSHGAPPASTPTTTVTMPGAARVTAVSVTPNPVEVDSASADATALQYAVTVENPTPGTSAATSVLVGIPTDGSSTLGPTAEATTTVPVPALAAGDSTVVHATGSLSDCLNCSAASYDWKVVACPSEGGPSDGCATSPVRIDVNGTPCGACWPDGTALGFTVVSDSTDRIDLGHDGASVPATIHVTNNGSDPIAAGLQAELAGFVGDHDPDLGWVSPAGVTQPSTVPIPLPSLAPGQSADVPVVLAVPGYTSTVRAQSQIWIRVRKPGETAIRASAHLDARLVPTYDGNEPDFTVEPGSVAVHRFYVGSGKTDTQSVDFTWDNVGGSDPSDTIAIAAQFSDQPTWDPAKPPLGEFQVDHGLTGTSHGSIALTWTGAAPPSARYVVVCADTSATEGYWEHVEASEANNCASTPVSFVDLDSAPAPVPGYDGALPAADPWGVSVVRPDSPELTASFGWERPGPFSWSPPLTDDQVWAIDPDPGVHATLTLPWTTFIENLTFDVTRVTLTEDTEPLPFQQVLTAVDIEPGDALTSSPFAIDFTLDAAVLDAVAQDDLVAFAADADGSDVRLLPLSPDADGQWSADHLRVRLSHLGIVGLATATAAQRAALQARVPTDDDQQIEAAGAPATLAARRAALSVAAPMHVAARTVASSDATAADPMDELRTSMVKRFNNVLVPAFENAANGGELDIEVAVQLGREWLRGEELLGDANGAELATLADELEHRIADLIDRHADLVKQQCVSGGGFSALRKMVQEMRTLQLAGHDAKSAELADALGACSSFRVSFDQTWADQNTNASLSGGLHSDLTLTAPSLAASRTGSVPSGTAPLTWTHYDGHTTDTYDTYDSSGNPVGHCEVTTTDTAKSGSYMDFYVKDYGLTFLRGGGHRPLQVSMWMFGSVLDPAIGYDVPVVIHRSRVSGCPDIEGGEWDQTDKPFPSDPAIGTASGGFRVLALGFADGHYAHSWSIVRSGDGHPTQESVTITVDPAGP
ncbi:MAG TPA: hypothetical protein VHO29_09645 [Marmoricola sp.]|nr:hypothetical protein [Marmoricola sp.]